MLSRREFLEVAAGGAVGAALTVNAFRAPARERTAEDAPNIIYIMLDEVGYYELSCMGHPTLRTPNIDRMAREGMRFTDALAGGCVCAPTRCSLLTGKHLGHATVRGNTGGLPIRADEETLGSMLKKAGYATGGFGKWGIGNRGTSGVPEKHGFDVFYGYYNQVHAHSYYPKYLIRNSEEMPLKGNPGDKPENFYVGETHAQHEIFSESVKFIRENAERKFFCYLPWTPPHGIWGVPLDDPAWLAFKDKPWRWGQKNAIDSRGYAALLLMVDRQIGDIFKLLKELGIDEKTIVFFCGDNGGSPTYFKSAEHPHGLFAPNKDPKTGKMFRGGKGNIYEGGLRVPMIVRWPGVVEAGAVNDHTWYFPDVMPTLAELTGAQTPKGADGISIAPTLTGKGRQRKHKYLYWEGGGRSAVRAGNWKAISVPRSDAWELYDLSVDIEESNNVGKANPDVLGRLVAYAKEAHEPIVKGEVYDEELFKKDHLVNGPKPPSLKGGIGK